MPEPTYTLAEAARILRRQECNTNGHDLETHIVREAGGRPVRHVIVCVRCSAAFQEITP